MKQNCKKQQKKNKQRQKGARAKEPIVKRQELNDFIVDFKLGFLQLIGKASLMFKSNLELSIILKQRELSESKHVAMERRCLKI